MEEEAKEKLEELGFEVIDASQATFRGYSVEHDVEHGCWVVYELNDYPQHGTLRRNLTGWGIGLSLGEALEWLQAHAGGG